MAILSDIYYYPIKGLPGLALDSVALKRGECIPFDRGFAIGDDSTEFDDNAPGHVRKQNLVVQMKHEKLAELQLDFETAQSQLRLSHAGDTVLDANLKTAAGKADTEAFFTTFLGTSIKAPARLISAPGLAFTDLSHKSLSIINLNSLRDIEARLGYPIDHRRFRANFYLDDIPAWSEENWLDKELLIGEMVLKVYRITDRCTAINVNPENASRDKVLQGLKQQFGHVNVGVYATVENDGTASRGQAVETPD